MKMVQHKDSKSGILGTAAFSDDMVYRYALGRVWDDEYPPAVWVMLNPSTASEQDDDPTIRRCVGFSRDWGCGGILVVNLFALRAKDPSELYLLNDPVGDGNEGFIEQMVSDLNPAFIVAGWGSHPLAQPLGISLAERLAPRPILCLGHNLDGSPKHPLYLAKGTRLEEW